MRKCLQRGRFFLLFLAVFAAGVTRASGPDLPAFAEGGDGKAQDVRPQDVIGWEAFQATEGDDGKISVLLRMIVKNPGWKVYTSNLKFGAPAGYRVDKTLPPEAKRFLDPISGHEVDVYEGGEFTLVYSGAPRWTAHWFPVTVTYVGCTNVICLFPYTETLDVAFTPKLEVAKSGGTSASEQLAAPNTNATANGTSSPANVEVSDDWETQLARRFSAGGLSLAMLLAIVFAGGLLSNLTPCVAPMVPITLRLLARQGASPYVSATFYALGIVVTYSVLGLVAALSGGLFGSLLASKPFNIAFAAIMIGLGFTMLGFGDLSKIQMLGNRLGAGRPSLGNTFLMGTGAGLVAAPCTGPILAALLAYTAKNASGIGTSTALLGTYSVGFALPYILLGGAAAKVSKIKVAPQVQIAVKLVFASVMFGLGLYYLRIPLYGLVEQIKAYWRPLAFFGMAFGAGMTLAWTFVPKLQNLKVSSVLPTFVLGLGLFAGSQWLTSAASGDAHAGQTWYHSEAAAFAEAKASHRPILIDMWAEWCEACKKMDAQTFTDKDLGAMLGRGWVLLKLDFTESTPANDALQAKYGVQSLPTLVLLPADGNLEKKSAIVGFTSAAALQNALTQFTQSERAE